MLGGHVSSGLCSQLVELGSGDTGVHTSDDFLCDHDWLNEVGIQAIGQRLDTSGDLVKTHWLLASVALYDVHVMFLLQRVGRHILKEVRLTISKFVLATSKGGELDFECITPTQSTK